MKTLWHNHQERGFTLLELLTAIAIISILTAVVIPSLGQARARARDSKRITAVTEIGFALEQFYSACSRQYPQPANPGDPLSVGLNSGCTGSIDLGSFLTTIPQDPLGADYVYAVGSGNKTYVIRASLETNDAALTDDLPDGMQLTIDCTDGPQGTPPRYYYCKGVL